MRIAEEIDHLDSRRQDPPSTVPTADVMNSRIGKTIAMVVKAIDIYTVYTQCASLSLERC